MKPAESDRSEVAPQCHVSCQTVHRTRCTLLYSAATTIIITIIGICASEHAVELACAFAEGAIAREWSVLSLRLFREAVLLREE